MRLIPGKTKVKIELFKGITLPDVFVGVIGLGLVALCSISSLPGRWIFAGVVAAIFVFLLFRLEDEPMYVLAWYMLKYNAYPRRFVRLFNDEALVASSTGTRQEIIDAFFEDEETNTLEENAVSTSEDTAEDEGVDAMADEKTDAMDDESLLDEREKKRQLKLLIKEENKILKSKTATEEEKNAVWQARADRSAAKKKEKGEAKDSSSHYEEVNDIMPFTGISDGFIEYGGEYYGAVIEIDPIEFRFFSEHRRNNSIENCFGKVLRGLTGDFGANIVKVQRPIIYDSYRDAEYEKLNQLKKSYESGLLTEEELQARVEIQYDRINSVIELCEDNKVIEPFYYLVLFEKDRDRLDTVMRQAVISLEQAELVVRRLGTRELALFLKYTNSLDFDEKELDNIEPEQWATWAMPETLKFSMRKVEVNGIITHNLRVISFPAIVGDSWLAGVMSFPSTKVMVKISPMDREKAIRAIDRSLSELRGQYMTTSIDSKMLELEEHIATLSSLLVTLQRDNEMLMSVNVYVTAYDGLLTSRDPLLNEDFDTLMPYVSDMKKTLKRSWNEAGLTLSGMDFLQLQAFIGSQVSNYDPMIKESRGIPTNTIAAMFPWIYAHISDVGGINLGTADGVPVFIDFFKRNEERVNSNMVIVGKSGSGKSYATKSLLTNLASEDTKVFILDPENEYSELAHTLHGKIINVGNAKYGRLNPFHIITALDDDEAGEEGGGPGGSFATHLQFLEEFFKQILPDIDRDALEYLNSLVERMYLNYGITPDTDLSGYQADDYPIFDDLYDIILQEFERTNNEYLRQLLRSLVNYIAKFATGGRNANIWNGPSTITTDENFSVFNFQSMLANRNTTIANAQMLLVLKYIDNEIIKNRDYNLKYGLKRKVVVVIDEAHVFIDTKFPVALDFMFQLAKRIRKYNGMQIVITQNIKDFVGSEEIARKSTAIINACQYSFVFGLAPNDMDDLCKLYEKAGGINESEQEDILGAKRGQAFVIMSPTSRSSFGIEVPESFVDMFENPNFESNYFYGEDGAEVWEDFVAESREAHDKSYDERKRIETEDKITIDRTGTLTFSEITEEEAEQVKAERMPAESAVDKMIAAEEAVNRKEYEMAVGRFGGINLTETTEDIGTSGLTFSEIDETDADFSKSGGSGLTFSEISEDEYNNDDDFELSYPDEDSHYRTEKKKRSTGSRVREDEETMRVAAQAMPVRGKETFSESYLKSTLEEFKKSIREEMERELAEKVKWMTLGAGLAMNNMEGQKTAPPYGSPDLTLNREAFPERYSDDENEEESFFVGDDSEEDEEESFFAGDESEDEYDEDEEESFFVGDESEDEYDEDEEESFFVGDESEDEYDEDEEESFFVGDESEDEYDEDEEESFFNDDLDEEEDMRDSEYINDEELDESYDYDSESDDERIEDEGYSSDDDSDYDSDSDEEDDSDDYEYDSDDEDEEYSSDDDSDDYEYDSDDEDEDYSLDDDDEEEDYALNDDDDEEYDDDDDMDFDDDDMDSLFDDGEEYEPAPFLFSELLAEAAEEYASMDLDERMEESGELVMEITLEELVDYIKKQRKKK